MDNIILITSALEYIENNLTEEVKAEDMAKELYCSKSSLEKLFKYVTNMSIHDYFIRRKMSKAAGEIATSPDMSLLELAVKYGYGSNEAFTRAFKNIWNVTPSEYRKNPVRFELFPAIYLEPELMEDKTMACKKKVDISELYDYICARKECYFIGVDIKSLIPINEVSHKAGDIAILTALQRLENATGEEDIVFRIGGDEFVAITDSKDEDYAKSIVEEIISHNGEEIEYEEKKIPLYLYVTYYKIESRGIRYSELFARMQNELNVEKSRCIKKV